MDEEAQEDQIGGVSTNHDDKPRSRGLRVGDEVCIVRKGQLVFGTVQYCKDQGGEGDRVYKVKWIHDPSLSVNEEMTEKELIPTNRTVYKGSRVRMEGKTGICRAVLHKVDLRIVGSNSILPAVNIEQFSHLKEYTQKSVVHYKGWLGVVLSTERKVTLQINNETTGVYDLNKVLPTGPFHIETHWINEQLDNFTCRDPPTASVTHVGSLGTKSDSGDTTSDDTNDDDNEPWRKSRRSLAFIRDLSIESVKIQWIHQIDPTTPDKPKQEFRAGSHTQLQLIKEYVTVDDLSFPFEVGNLGRIWAKSSSVEYLRWDDWQRKFAALNLPTEISKQLLSGLDYERILDKQWRVYNQNEKKNCELEGCGDENKENSNKRETEGGSSSHVKNVDEHRQLVVEIARVCTIPDIVWEDNTSELPSSSLDLEIMEDALLSDAELPLPGDFIWSKLLPNTPAYYCVVLRHERTTLGHIHLVVRVLDAEVPGKVLKEQAIVTGTDLRFTAKFVERHPIYQYFNEGSTIVVVNEDGPHGAKIRIGNVVGTNLQGKVNVRFMGHSSKYREEWVWPQVCAIYSVKGFDLECVKSNVVDNDSSIELEMKVRSVIETLESKVELVWKNVSKSELDLSTSLQEFSFIFQQFTSICKGTTRHLNHSAYTELTTYLALPIGVLDGRPLYLKGDDTLTKLVLSAVQQLLPQATSLLQRGDTKSTSSSMEVIDLSESAPGCSSSHLNTNPLETIFSDTAALLDNHPESHFFAKKTEFKPDHGPSFIKSVMEEFQRLKKICSTSTKAEMGILSRCYSDRMDLLSFLIRGPSGTPYEDALFIFDAYLPSSYPNVPPQFQFHAFNAGRLNPNLYAEGKVCVSLLGTWAGRYEREKWTKDSNIVQILISIQGLILVNEPFHNEPGFEVSTYSSRTETMDQERHRYNSQILPLIVKMMINQVSFGMEPFSDSIHAFYKLQVPVFLARWRKWLAASSEASLGMDKPSFSVFPITTPFKTEMEKQLNALEAIWKSKLR